MAKEKVEPEAAQKLFLQAWSEFTGEVSDWAQQSSEELQKWRAKLAQNKGEIIN